ncbi:hypothetical protein C9F10_23505, partial [Salmonella enterica subsp. enterica serovar Poona]
PPHTYTSRLAARARAVQATAHIPTTPALSALRQVLCYDGYLTPQNPHNQQHCIGASYHRGDESTVWREEDQRQNRQRLLDCFPDAKWATEVAGWRCSTSPR